MGFLWFGMARQNRDIGVLDKFIREGHEALSSFAKTDRVNFNEKESASIYYGIMASAVKHNIGDWTLKPV